MIPAESSGKAIKLGCFAGMVGMRGVVMAGSSWDALSVVVDLHDHVSRGNASPNTKWVPIRIDDGVNERPKKGVVVGFFFGGFGF